MDFYVYDNEFTFNNRNLQAPNSRLYVSDIKITPNGGFWFYTNLSRNETNVNIQGRYIHFHPGITSTNSIKFEKEPFLVPRSSMSYNPKTKKIEIRNSIY